MIGFENELFVFFLSLEIIEPVLVAFTFLITDREEEFNQAISPIMDLSVRDVSLPGFGGVPWRVFPFLPLLPLFPRVLFLRFPSIGTRFFFRVVVLHQNEKKCQNYDLIHLIVANQFWNRK